MKRFCDDARILLIQENILQELEAITNVASVISPHTLLRIHSLQGAACEMRTLMVFAAIR